MAELSNQDPKSGPSNQAAALTAKITAPTTTVEDKAGNAAKKAPGPKAPFYQPLCDLADLGLDTASDVNSNMNMSDFSLDPYIKQYKIYKKKVQDEVEGWIASQAPDSVRPILLAVVIAKRLKDMIQMVQCATKAISAVAALLTAYSTAITKTMNKIRRLINKNLALIKRLQADLVNMPGWILAVIVHAVSDKLLESLSPGDLLKNALKLAIELKKLKNSVTGLNGFVNAQINAIRNSVQGVCKTLMNAANDINSLDWHLVKPNLLQTFLAVASPEERMLVSVLNKLIAENKPNAHIFSAGGATGSDTTTVKKAGSTQEQIKVVAKQLYDEIGKGSNNTALMQSKSSEILYEVNKFAAKLERYVDLMNKNEEMIASLHTLDVKNMEIQANIESVQKTDFTVDTRPLEYSSQASLSFTLTNDTQSFTDLNGVTNADLINMFNSAQDNTWVDIFSSNKPGQVLIGGTRFGAIELDSRIDNPKFSLGLRLLIDNGLYSIEAFSREASDIEGGTNKVSFGKFVNVPLAPNQDMTKIITVDEFRIAANNPRTAKPNNDYVLAVPFDTNLSAYISHSDDTDYYNGFNGDAWQRYMTQVEINEMEEVYLNSLVAFNLSPKFPVNEMLHTQTVWPGITRHYTFPTDIQLSTLLVGTKPYNGMKIPANSITLQFSKINMGITDDANMVATELNPLMYSFGLQSEWGFLSQF